jgi:hypothetical protein
MNAFETFLLNLGKAAIATAPSALPIFVHSSNGIAIANVSEEFLAAFLSMAQASATPAPTVTTTTISTTAPAGNVLAAK